MLTEQTERWQTMLLRAALMAVAAIAPLAFPAAQKGIASMATIARFGIVPAAAVLIVAAVLLARRGGERTAALARALRRGALAGALATLALEAVRYPGFRLGTMPGNMPELMGVLLMNRFALGPSLASTLAGFAYHFWNGACFGMIFALLPVRHSLRLALPYAWAIAVGLMMSPVVESLGVGLFGVEYGWQFAATVVAAHTGFGLVLGGLLGSRRLGLASDRARSPSEPQPQQPHRPRRAVTAQGA